MTDQTTTQPEPEWLPRLRSDMADALNPAGEFTELVKAATRIAVDFVRSRDAMIRTQQQQKAEMLERITELESENEDLRGVASADLGTFVAISAAGMESRARIRSRDRAIEELREQVADLKLQLKAVNGDDMEADPRSADLAAEIVEMNRTLSLYMGRIQELEGGPWGEDVSGATLHEDGGPDVAERPCCPRCGSHNPRLHPAVQAEGEVHICPNLFHEPTVATAEVYSGPQPSPEMREVPADDVALSLLIRQVLCTEETPPADAARIGRVLAEAIRERWTLRSPQMRGVPASEARQGDVVTIVATIAPDFEYDKGLGKQDIYVEGWDLGGNPCPTLTVTELTVTRPVTPLPAIARSNS